MDWALLEAFSYLKATDVLLVTSLVCKNWNNLGNDNDLWTRFLSSNRLFSPQRNVLAKNWFKENYPHSWEIHILSSNTIAQFSCRKQTWELIGIRPGLEIDAYSSSIQITDGRVLCCGGKGKDCVYVLKTNGEAKKANSMRRFRWLHGLIYVQKTVYAFGGGILQVRNTCEKLCFDEENQPREWENLPNMIWGRYMFNPCVLGLTVFLCGGFTEKCEVFDIEKERFSPLDFTLQEKTDTVAVVSAGQIVVLTQRFVSSWKAGVVEHKMHQELLGGLWGGMNAVLYDSTVYSSHRERVCAFDLRTLRKTAIANPYFQFIA